ncbi:TRAP transporter large permease subunit [Chloroflexota bacterium]
MSIEVISVVLFVTLFVFLLSGLPVAFALGGVAFLFGILFIGPNFVYIAFSQTFRFATSYLFISVPMFVYMANILAASGVAEQLYDAVVHFIGFIKGGLAVVSVVCCTIMAAMVGISTAGVMTMGVLAYPEMVRYNYDRKLAAGSIAAAGALGSLIPPSLTLVVLGALTETSVIALFAAGILPGLLLAGLFIAYILVRCTIQPDMGPPIRQQFTWGERMASLKGLVLPAFLIAGILGGLFGSIFTATEASGVGAVGAFICAFINRRFNMKMFKKANINALRTTGMVMWLVFASAAIGAVYSATGASQLVKDILAGANIPPLAVIGIMQVILIFLGCFMDPTGIILICIPIFTPVVKAMGFDIIWFLILFEVNLEMGFLTPPFGFNLFVLRGILDPPMTMGELYRAAVLFILVQATGLAILMLFPNIALILPQLITR